MFRVGSQAHLKGPPLPWSRQRSRSTPDQPRCLHCVCWPGRASWLCLWAGGPMCWAQVNGGQNSRITGTEHHVVTGQAATALALTWSSLLSDLLPRPFVDGLWIVRGAGAQSAVILRPHVKGASGLAHVSCHAHLISACEPGSFVRYKTPQGFHFSYGCLGSLVFSRARCEAP